MRSLQHHYPIRLPGAEFPWRFPIYWRNSWNIHLSRAGAPTIPFSFIVLILFPSWLLLNVLINPDHLCPFLFTSVLPPLCLSISAVQSGPGLPQNWTCLLLQCGCWCRDSLVLEVNWCSSAGWKKINRGQERLSKWREGWRAKRCFSMFKIKPINNLLKSVNGLLNRWQPYCHASPRRADRNCSQVYC